MINPENNNIYLWKSFKEGDRSSFENIYSLYFKNLYEYGLRIADDKELVKDAIHDLFVKLWANKFRLGEVNNIKSYLLVSLRSNLFNKLEKSAKTQSVEVPDHYNFAMAFSIESTLIEQEQASEHSRRLLQALNQISSRQKEVIYLKYFEELDYDEIAVIMGISTKATYKLTARALAALREIMNIPKAILLIFLDVLRSELFQ